MNTINHAFHSATYRLLGFAPEISSAADQTLADAEKRLGIQLPQSVREWYRRNDAIRILAEHSNDDPPIAVECFELIEWRSGRLLPIRNENQGVCRWAVALDSSDDPAVYVDVDTGGKNWQLLSPTFSKYVYSSVWDYRSVLHKPALVQAQNRALSDAALNALSASFQQEIQTYGWPGSAQYRFANSHGAVLIWASEQQADWFAGAPNANSLEFVLRTIWDLDDVGPVLYATSDIGEEILTRLRGGKGK